MKEIKILLKKQVEYIKERCNLKLDKKWSREDLGERAKQKGVYIIFTTKPKEIIYVGKTRGKRMDFATRLYRHVSARASSNSRVYRKLKGIDRKGVGIKVSLINSIEIEKYFSSNEKKLSDKAIIDIFEQVLIHYLHPTIQDN